MAMTGPGMAAAIISAMSSIEGQYINPADNHQLPGFDIDEYNNQYFNALAGAIVSYIKANAKAIGVDSPSADTHILDIT